MEGVTEGRMVHYVLPESRVFGKGQHRPAIIVNAHGGKLEGGRANLIVFLDCTNDFDLDVNGVPALIMWANSVSYSDDHESGTWHWPERL
ncbi:hypothetical protein P4H66_19485 [Paenibacillus dokdonensis]|uniref:Uncharacterized protein n=1 Tax=Paenibacillus dokdonensis TaxID=2567944 RepID=A0ABU6GQI5_9BACL|nr:hypothetical protein [Paenibacillus dokdonensis]MEC0241989.1 hypothetical protein [Paenibacillus dokdonensis]